MCIENPDRNILSSSSSFPRPFLFTSELSATQPLAQQVLQEGGADEGRPG